jgi:hypothetical protein
MTRPRRRQILLALLSGAWLPANTHARGGRGTVRLYRANGRYAGRIEANGRYYGENGRYLGRVEGNRIYSAQGRYLGRFEESGVFHDAAAMPGGAGRIGPAGTDRGDDPRAGAPDRDIVPGQPPVAHETRPSLPDAPTRVPSPAEGSVPAANATQLPPVAARPTPVFGTDPTAGQPIIEIIRPDRGTR